MGWDTSTECQRAAKGADGWEAGVRSLGGAHSPKKQAEKPQPGALQQEGVSVDIRRNRPGGWALADGVLVWGGRKHPH